MNVCAYFYRWISVKNLIFITLLNIDYMSTTSNVKVKLVFVKINVTNYQCKIGTIARYNKVKMQFFYNFNVN